MPRFRAVLATAVVAAGFAACDEPGGDPGEETCTGERCDDDADERPLDTECNGTLIDQSGRGFLPASIASDPLVKFVYTSSEGGCPVTFEEILAKIDRNDDRPSCEIRSRAVSEQAQLHGVAGAGYRIVSNRHCFTKSERFELMISQFGFAETAGAKQAGLDTAGKAFPGGVEIAAFDDTRGVFNYYKEVGGKMAFFGSSHDFVEKGPGGPGVTSIRGCGNCHTGGGLIMKELQFPWMHWEGQFDSPGADTVVLSRPKLGPVSDGIDLENLVENANLRVARARVERARTRASVADLLRPLFCPVEVNIATSTRTGGGAIEVDNRFWIDPRAGFFTFEFSAADYQAARKAIGMNVPGTANEDTRAELGYLSRATADVNYVDNLVDLGIVDAAFVADVLMIDFTRPVTSDDRCDLLAAAPELEPDDRTPAAIRRGFIDNLRGAAAGTPEAELLARLEATEAGKPLDATRPVKTFEAECQLRNVEDRLTLPGGAQIPALLADVLKIRSLHRKLAYFDAPVCQAAGLPKSACIDDKDGSAAHPRRLFEFQDTLAFDKIAADPAAAPADLLAVHPDARFSPRDCRLTDRYVSGVLPQCKVTFIVHGVDFTQPGQNVVITGRQPELGAFRSELGLTLSGATFPTWRGTFDLPQGIDIQYKATVRTDSTGTTQFETGDNRAAKIPSGKDCATEIEIDFRR